MPTIRLTQMGVDRLAQPKSWPCRLLGSDATRASVFALLQPARNRGFASTESDESRYSRRSGHWLAFQRSRTPGSWRAKAWQSGSRRKSSCAAEEPQKGRGRYLPSRRRALRRAATRRNTRNRQRGKSYSGSSTLTCSRLGRSRDGLDHAPRCCRPAGRHRTPRIAGAGESHPRPAENPVRLGGTRGNH